MAKDICKQLDPIFKAKSVAFIGATTNQTKWGFRTLQRALKSGYRGAVYPINPGGGEMFGLKVYSDVNEVPNDIDLAIFTIPAARMPQAMKSCVKKGIKGGVIISADFAETGEKGKALEDETVKIARSGGMRFLGPNGMGVWISAVQLNVALEPEPTPGPLAFISQSGTYGGGLAQIAKIKGYGLSKFLSIGNQADLKAADLVEYMAQDPDTKVIGLYMEGFKDGRRFFEVARNVVKEKPIVIYKGGSTSVGARATMSHTASIAGADEIFDSMCKQAGILRAREVEHLFVMAEALISDTSPRGNRVGIIGSGGQGVVAVDSCASLGLEVPQLDEKSRLQMKKNLPPHAPIPNNPVDFAGGARTAVDEARMAEELAKLDYIDGIITNVPITHFRGRNIAAAVKNGIEGAEILTSIPEKYGKSVIAMRWRGWGDEAVVNMFRNAKIPMYDTPENCARAMYALVKYAEIKNR
ncbi:MAG: CoA-binding protein [Deltaproteobacteria bacterium]|nr:CoA-binding protein [Deltaproteobacteria bacterium]MBW2051603.1 CoA-binding protein [Deltaproteobacteria bacterium]MBW2140156.1 CoA-binding protein [Deltaproteobacteria bacterium]MBW2322925.1 CoA-binding protein [Deltaproteobacteria bacterium]